MKSPSFYLSNNNRLIHALLEQIDAKSFISKYVDLELKTKTTSTYEGNSPFSEGAIIQVVNSVGMFKCFGTGLTGNIFTFIMELRKVTFDEAILIVLIDHFYEMCETNKSKIEGLNNN